MQSLNFWMLLGMLPMGLGWFLTNTYFPWLSAWLETSALSSVLVLSIAAWQLTRCGSVVAVRLSPPLAGMTMLVLASLALQLAMGVVFFVGDAVMVLAYLLAWLLAVYVGQVVARTEARQNLDAFWFAVLGAATLSVGLALMQWLDVEGLNIFLLDMPVGARPFANLGQPNNFCTLCFLGCAGLLYFHERGVVRGTSFGLAWCWLSFGMALSQSRTGWLQIVCLVVGLWWLGQRIPLRVRRHHLVGMGIVFTFWVVTLPWLADALLVTAGRTLGEQMQGGVRFSYWLSMLEAVLQRPWLGYGWLQTGLAQQLDSASAFRVGIFDFSHNIALDAVLWTGLPLGLGIVFCFLFWTFQQFRRLNNGIAVMTMLALAGVMVHALLEYPLAYAYFLVPFGFIMGTLHGLIPSAADSGWVLGRRFMAGLAMGVAGFFAIIAHDYFSVENAVRNLRFESAHIGLRSEPVPVPTIRLLTQLDALMRYGYRDPGENISKEEWQKTGWISDRFGLSFVMFRYALASGFYGDSVGAKNTLEKICRVHNKSKCQNVRIMWSQWGKKYPFSIGSIDFPEVDN